MSTYSINIKKEIIVCIAACGVIAFSPFLSLFVKLTRSVLVFPYKLDTLFVYGIFVLILLLSLKTIITRSSLVLYFIIIFLLSGYLISFVIEGYHIEYYLEFGINFLAISAPWLLITYAVRDYGLLKKYLNISALIIIVSYIMNVYIIKTDIFGDALYTQSYSYAILPAAIVLCSNLFERIHLFNLVLFTITIIFILSMGARGPLICVVLYLLLKIIIMYKSRPKKVFLLTTAITATCVSIYLFSNKILSLMLILFQEANLSTRIVLRLLQGTYFEDSARSLLSKYSIELIMQHPLIGVGIGNDRLLLANKMQNIGVLEAIGWYPHNIFLEFLLQFGVVLGGAIIIFMLIVLYKSIVGNFEKDAVDIICIFIGIGFFPLLFSGSYITSPLFFALMGFSFFQYKKLNVRKPVGG